ncbi:16786_t:CDS:2, partial [Cetraspora pellucida]
SLLNIKNQNSWCPQCAHIRSYNLKYSKYIATKKSGIRLSENYINMFEPLHWKCAMGTFMDCTLHSIKNHGVYIVQRWQVISDELIDSKSHLHWKCVKGNIQPTIEEVKKL